MNLLFHKYILSLNGSLYTWLLCLLLCGCSHEQHEADEGKEKLIPVAALREDLKVLRASLQEIHPGLYSYLSKDSMAYYFDEALSRLDHEMTRDEFVMITSGIFRKIYDEHTFINVTYKYGSLRSLLPVKVRWANSIPFIYKSLTNDPRVITGSEIVSINGRSPHDIYKEIASKFPPSGYTDPDIKYDVISLHFDYLYASFFEQPDSFIIEAISPASGKRYTVSIPSLPASDTVRCIPIRKMAEEFCRKDTCYRFRIDEAKSLAIMTISGLHPNEMKAAGIDFTKAISESFKAMDHKKIGNLVIDLRYCFGGDPSYGAELLTHLHNKPFRIFDTLSVTLDKIPTYSRYLDWTTEDWAEIVPLLKELKEAPSASNDLSFLRDTLYTPNKQQFKGNIFVLINSDIHSAAAITSALLKHHTKATFIGAPIAGPGNSGNSIEMVTLTLPHTRLEVYIPMIHYSYAVPDNLFPYKKGISPDIVIYPTPKGLINGQDEVMDSTIELIMSGKVSIKRPG